MSLLDVGELLKIFYKNPLSYIPLLDFNQKEEGYIVGFLSRSKVLQHSADKSKLEEKFTQIPDSFIDKKIQPMLYMNFFKKHLFLYTISSQNILKIGKKKNSMNI